VGFILVRAARHAKLGMAMDLRSALMLDNEED
jgi:hypothetical protein